MIQSVSDKFTHNIANESEKDKNPKNDNGWTPLHSAASSGHFEICHLILESVKDKNPMNDFGITPLDMADYNDHREICKLIGKR